MATNKYGFAAVEAARMAQGGRSPGGAWDAATCAAFGPGTPSQIKSCPRGAFLGLAGAGRIVNVPAGSYTKSFKNASYALEAVELLAKSGDAALPTPSALWEEVMDGVSRVHNSQMDVVLALWVAGLISAD